MVLPRRRKYPPADGRTHVQQRTGIYIVGEFGIRTEDEMLITEQCARPLLLRAKSSQEIYLSGVNGASVDQCVSSRRIDQNADSMLPINCWRMMPTGLLPALAARPLGEQLSALFVARDIKSLLAH